MEFLGEYLGVFTSAAVAAIAAGFGGFIWKRVQDINKLFKDAEVQGGSSAPGLQVANLRREVRDLKIIAAEASARAARALAATGAEDLAADLKSHELSELRQHLSEDIKSLHRRAANAFSFHADDISPERVKPLLSDMADLQQIFDALNDRGLSGAYRGYRDSLTDLARELCSSNRKTDGHTAQWRRATDNAEEVLNSLDALTPGLRENLRKLNIKTQWGMQTLF